MAIQFFTTLVNIAIIWLLQFYIIVIFTPMKNLYVFFVSLSLTCLVVGHAAYQKKQFYPTVVYITKSSPSMAVLYIQALMLVYLIGKLARKVFFGSLRTVEMENMLERFWYVITDSCLAFTIFRNDLSPKFIALFTVLVFLKTFHWLTEDRIDYMERSPTISVLFHVRVVCLLTVLAALDLYLFCYSILQCLAQGVSVHLVFGFEYAILFCLIVNSMLKYLLHSVDLVLGTPWVDKPIFLLYTELTMCVMKVSLYLTFMALMVRLYTVPLFAFRPMYQSVQALKKALSDVILSQRAIRIMNNLYPDATAEDLRATDEVCIICREEMTYDAKKLPCNHIFHKACLRSWFQRQQTCPICRLNILRGPPPTENNVPPTPHPQTTTAAEPPPASPLPPPSQAPFIFSPFFVCPLPVITPLPPIEALTQEQLQHLERSNREAILHRIRLLHDIKTLLDTSVVLINQYNSISAFENTIPFPEPNESPSNNLNATSSVNSSSSNETMTPN